MSERETCTCVECQEIDAFTLGLLLSQPIVDDAELESWEDGDEVVVLVDWEVGE